MAFFFSFFVTGKEAILLVILISLVVDDVEELELVNTARGGDDTEPVTKLLLLEELLGPMSYIFSKHTKSRRCIFEKEKKQKKHTGT